MNITTNVASLNWRTNTKGTWKALVKDLSPNTAVTFSDSFTGVVTGKQIAVESPTMPTGFVTYTTDDTNVVVGGVLYGAGTAYDSVEAVSGEKTVRMGSYTFTGEETFTFLDASPEGVYTWKWNGPSDRKVGSSSYTVILSGYICLNSATVVNIYQTGMDKHFALHPSYTWIYIRNDSCTTAEQIAADMVGKTIYYELATPTTSTETAQSMTLDQGSDTLGGGSFSATYEGTEYEIQLYADCSYIYRNANGTNALLKYTSNIKLPVSGGIDKLINLTHWFGLYNEPSLEEFFVLYPTWKDADIPYNHGFIVNYKGTGIQTIGFNAYDHTTGTAELLGGNKYQICGTFTSVSYVDQWGDTEELELDAEGIFIPTNNGTLTVVGGNATDTCVHLCRSGYKNFGEREYQWEPFIRNIHNIDVVQYFPNGMNGFISKTSRTAGAQTYADELFVDHQTRMFNTVDMGSLTWGKVAFSNGYRYYATVPDMVKTPGQQRVPPILSTRFYTVNGSYGSGIHYNMINIDTTDKISVYIQENLTVEQFTTMVTGEMLVYACRAPVTTQLSSPINLIYPVNDFGTEQSLPINTTDLITTDLHALIRYNTDYMRMNTQLSEIFPTVRSLAQQEQDGKIMKTDATAPNATVGNAYNIIDRNAAGTERQFSFDTAGGTQDITDGTAVAKKLMGTTLNLNQLVHDTNENTVNSVDGNATVTDAVEGNVKHLVVSGDTVVVNQLVHEYVEKTETGVDRIWIKDAAEGAAKGLKITAPRSVVRNQHIDTTDTSVTLMNGHTWLTKIGGSSEIVSGTGQSVSCTGGTDMAVDLTQYFNGNTTLINSLSTWDDLVAYDSTFANYVAYNTGTVAGVTPGFTLNGANSEFVTAPQEMFGVGTASDDYDVIEGMYTTRIGSYTFTGEETWTLSDNWLTNALASLAVFAPNKFVISNRLLGQVSASSSGAYSTDNYCWIRSVANYKHFYVCKSTITDPSDMASFMTGVTVYFELSTPVETPITPVAFNLVSHDNTIFQTSGALKSTIQATYDGLNQTITLDPTHTYIVNHQYISDSIITNESSIDCVGSEDNLVDLTQLYNGDSTRISAIHSWASLSSKIHMYRDWLPYIPGEIVNLAATIRVYQHEYAYGVIYDPSQSSPVCQKVELHDGVLTQVEEFSSLPVHDRFYRCVMDDLANRHINYYLDDTDSTKKYNGTRNGVTSDGSASVLTGADGDVMVEMPITHWSIDEDYNGEGKILWLISDQPFTGSEIHPYFYVSPNGDTPRVQYVGAYRAVGCDENGNALNTTEGAITQITGTASTRLLRSVSGALPWVNNSLASMRTDAVRHGGTMVNRLFHEYLFLIMSIEQATLNCQSISMGYSNGKTNALWAWRKSGRANYGNGTGEIFAVSGTQDDDNFYSLKVNNVQLYRDVDRDANNYYAWSNHAATPTVYWTASATPVNGDTAYSDTEGTSSGYTVASWSTTADANKIIQFQYRGIENPWGEVWEFDDGVQKYQKCVLTVIRVNNILHYVNHLKDGTGTKTAWMSEDGTSTYWTTTVTPANNSIAYMDSDCTVDSGYKITQITFIRIDCEMWESMMTAYYTSTDQHTTVTKVYNKKRYYWPSGSWIKKFDPRSFLPRTTGGSGSTYLCDNWYNDNGTGSRVVYRGGGAYNGALAGLGYVIVAYGLTHSHVVVSGRLSA